MSAMSLRQAWRRGSRRTDGPSSAIRRSMLEEDSPFLGGAAAAGAFLLLDVAFEALKEILPYAGLGDEYVAAVRLVTLLRQPLQCLLETLHYTQARPAATPALALPTIPVVGLLADA